MSADLNSAAVSYSGLASSGTSRDSQLLIEGATSSFHIGLMRNSLDQNLNLFQTPTDATGCVEELQTTNQSPDNLPPPATTVQISITSIETDTAKTNGSSSAFSDTSSDVSDITAPLPNSGSTYVVPVVEGISEQDINQVDLFYRSHKTEVKVCRSLANLYISAAKTKGITLPPPSQNMRGSRKSFREKKPKSSEIPAPVPLDSSDFAKDDWEFTKTGIPVLVLDSGDHVRDKRLKIVLAEKGTGFTLWEDQFSHFTEYSTPHSNFHTITISSDSTRLAGLSFDEANAAAEFAEAIRSYTSSADDNVLKSSTKKKKKKDKPKQKYKPPKKVDISQPVCFVHVTKLKRPDLFPPPPCGAELDRLGIPRAVSDSSGISECSSTPSEH